ncbi:isoleucine--tRNA ligase [Marinilabilia salmonicolor]|uniref:Isoleucine--tRNA ligase n=1 Tax=Marinilabilia salmonicolor TaxID=989 RepID=A0A368UPG7_9BACT|nr:isoleucine--tRNA ligase [Marinilabilia salmonicolor]RCW30065.1 isoleucyl-tRNA synthetase [Marinilabilia salmonicolor]
MSKKFPEYKGLNLADVNREVLKEWEANKTFDKSLSSREGRPSFVFYEGPPSANGMPGIHHVMARTIKDIFCRFKTQQGYQVHRKAGWDTHGLPVELGVEKTLGITKEDIGKSISVAEYNEACRKDVMKYTDMWEDLTHKMGYWVDMDHPYITYDNRYIETLWWMLKELYKKGLLYKGYTIQPFSPAAGTGLSTHELNQPGCYRDVKDTTCTGQFKVVKNNESEFLFKDADADVFFLAWTTTPWTFPSNTALAVGSSIKYVRVRSFNPYTGEPLIAVVAKDLVNSFFNPKNAELSLADYTPGDKKIPFEILDEFDGQKLIGLRYEQLIPWVKPDGDAFRVIAGDFVTTEDGTGIVHIAPTFGADDNRVGKEAGIAPLLLLDKDGKQQPMVDRTGKFFLIKDLDPSFVKNNVDIDTYSEFSGRFVKNGYDEKLTDDDPSLDVDIAVMLKKENKAFKVEKYEHSYPHCWRTDKPVLYYPLDSWFIKTTAVRDKMMELNNTINWKPQSTGTGRFGKWLENLVDWNLSRSRYWGTPLPIWRTEDGSEEKCIGSVEELVNEIDRSVKAGFMDKNPFGSFNPGDFSDSNYNKIDLHRPYVDDVILVSETGKRMVRETDLIDVWFDSGAMPYAQMHYPFEGLPLAPSQGGGTRTETPNDSGEERPAYETGRPSTYNGLAGKMKEMRKEPTEAENVLWQQLRNKQVDECKFRRQHAIDQFIVDFVCLSKMVIVEVDGGYHEKADVKKADEQRTKILENLGYKVIRFSNEEVIGNTGSVIERIKNVLNTRKDFSDKSNPSSPLGGDLRGAGLPPLGGIEGGSLPFPADFIAEGVDQTRGWFFTLHALATMLFDSVAFKNIISNGLVLDKNGNKMSKRLGNAVDPFKTIDEHGSDPLRWYMITNAQPWDNLKFDLSGVDEVKRKFFGTLYNTYSFFALYANIDGFDGSEAEVPVAERPEIDRWIISLLNTLTKEVTDALENYEPTRAGRAIQNFVTENLSNWYVRLNRKRFWGGEMNRDKLAAYQTLYQALETVAMLAAPIAPFYADRLFTDLNKLSGRHSEESVHLAEFPAFDEAMMDKALEERMEYAQQISSMVLALRRKVNIKVRQPLQKVMLPVYDDRFEEQIEAVKDLVLTEVNIKEIEYLKDASGVLVKKIKPNFKTLGPRYGKMMKAISKAFAEMSQEDIAKFEQENNFTLVLDGETVELNREDAEIISEDIPGMLVANEGRITVALDINLTPELKAEGIARELINRIQNLRKDSGFEVTDKIVVNIQKNGVTDQSVNQHKEYIAAQTLAKEINLVDSCNSNDALSVELQEDVILLLEIEKV